MILEITSTPRETHVWAQTAQHAGQLRRELTDSGFLVLDADPWELDQQSLIPEGEHLEFNPARVFDVSIGADANATLHALVDSGHTLTWHRWQTRLSRKVWGVTVAIPPRGRRRPATIESAEHFGLKVRGSRELGLRMTRETYARINKRSSSPRWHRDDNPELWDSLSDIYEDADHRILTDEWCAENQKQALENFDLNMAHFASLDHHEFEQALQHAVSGRRKLTEEKQQKTFGEHLRSWRMVQGLTAQQVCERADISPTTLRNLERGGGGVRFETVLQVARALGILDSLVESVDPLRTDLGRARARFLNRKRAR
jgi:DNA-binding XRE family transcriptional regulator